MQQICHLHIWEIYFRTLCFEFYGCWILIYLDQLKYLSRHIFYYFRLVFIISKQSNDCITLVCYSSSISDIGKVFPFRISNNLFCCRVDILLTASLWTYSFLDFCLGSGKSPSYIILTKLALALATCMVSNFISIIMD